MSTTFSSSLPNAQAIADPAIPPPEITMSATSSLLEEDERNFLEVGVASKFKERIAAMHSVRCFRNTSEAILPVKFKSDLPLEIGHAQKQIKIIFNYLFFLNTGNSKHHNFVFQKLFLIVKCKQDLRKKIFFKQNLLRNIRHSFESTNGRRWQQQLTVWLF